MFRFFTTNSPIDGKYINLEGEDYTHIKNSLRMKIGEKIQIVSGETIYIVEIIEISIDEIKTKIIERDLNEYESNLYIHLYQGYCKGDKMDFIIQKAVELGVNEITPIFTKRTIVRLKDDKIAGRMSRFNKIIIEAAKQSKRKIVPMINQPINLEDLEFSEDLILVAYEDEKNSIKNELMKNFNSVSLIIGPEGGFEENEIDSLITKGANSISLGNRILRAETASLSLITILQFEKGDLN